MVSPRALSGGAPLLLGGRRWWLRITYRVLLACEEAADVDMLSASMDVSRPSARLMLALLWAALASAGAPWSLREAGARVDLRSLPGVQRALLEAWISSMPDAAPAKSAKKAPRKRPATWLDVWAVARGELGLSEEEWLDMTPRQLAALHEVRTERLRREEWLVGTIAATVANFGFRAPARALSAETFMIHEFDPAPEVPVTGEMIMAVLRPFKQNLGKVS
jgi:hypothetical protein